MPRLIFTQAARDDLVRLHDFLQAKSANAAARAKTTLLAQLESLTAFPEVNRPIAELPYCRDMIIRFGATGYVIRYRYVRGEDVVVLALRHQKEFDIKLGG